MRRDIVKTLSNNYDRLLLRREYRSDYVAGMIFHAWGIGSLPITGGLTFAATAA